MKTYITLTALLLFPMAVAAQDVETLTPSGDPAPVRAVKLITAGGSEAIDERVFFGRIAAKETLDLSFEVGGRMTMFAAQEGEFLEEGVQIAALDLAPFERAVERAGLQLGQAGRDLERAQTLAASNVGSETQAENAKTARDLAAVSLREAEDALENATLLTPFRALVASRLTPQFANVTPGQPIVRLHDMSEVRVEVDVPERLFQQVSDVTGITFTGVSPLFESEVPLELREFNAETRSIGQSYRVTFALPTDLNSVAIIPGASMTVTARARLAENGALTLPPSAISMTDSQAKVMVFNPDESQDIGTVSWVEVEVSSSAGTDLVVTGLAPEDQIVAVGAQMLSEGETVRRFTGLGAE